MRFLCFPLVLQKREFEQRTESWTNSISAHLGKVKTMVGEFSSEMNKKFSSLEQSQSEMNELDEELEKILIKRRKLLSDSRSTAQESGRQLDKFSSEVGMEIDSVDTDCQESSKSVIQNMQEVFVSHAEEISKVLNNRELLFS